MGPRTKALLGELKKWCEAEKGRQNQLAELFGVSRQSVSAWLRGKRMPTGEQVLEIQAFLATHKKRVKTEKPD